MSNRKNVVGPHEDGTKPLLRPEQKTDAAAILAARKAADEGVGNAICAVNRAGYDKPANML